MFTGLVEEMGTISQLLQLDETSTGGQGTSLTITSCPAILSDAKLGDSIACNGTCLTITELLLDPTTTAISPSTLAVPTAFKVTIAPETLRRTNLGSLKEGMKMNLERAARGDTRMGGHYVQGHVDAVAAIQDIRDDGNAVIYRFSFNLSEASKATLAKDTASGRETMKFIVEKGYISIDGASLTVTQENGEWWEVMLIPYTRERIVMGSKRVGDLVNIEVDMVGKYVEKSVKAQLQGEEVTASFESLIRKIVAEELHKVRTTTS